MNDDGFARAIDFKIPDKPDITRGRIPNTEPVQEVKPHVLGLDAAEDSDALRLEDK